MTEAIFDSLDYYNQLKAAGFSDQQAEVQAHALVHLVQEKLATKEDINNLKLATKEDINNLKLATKEDINNLKLATQKNIHELKNDIEELRTATQKDMDKLEERLTYKLTIRFGGMMASSVMILAVLIKIL